ncbi:hypothetical protein HHL23_09205 [Chryseobacterium sp. RP-3-3]|uniref:Lipocalin-like domain-containing protein n=1 Tax=Chryseobacterium antibioticum TaxID=2728847 RepID=A0A7Y0FRU2_9FLAO|nr:hypothetical protein [Chryseobacterium antibioticum]NML69976.1 hypothetical protein [Chryseobacterium antibioticum]
MKKILLLFISITVLSVQSCMNQPDDEGRDILHNERQLQNELIGTWKFWGRFSIERNNWIAAGPNQLFTYRFRSDGTYSYMDKTDGKLLNGEYNIIPATEKANPYILLNYNDNGEISSKKLLIIFLDNKFISIFEHPNEDRYQKQLP